MGSVNLLYVSYVPCHFYITFGVDFIDWSVCYLIIIDNGLFFLTIFYNEKNY